MSEDPIAYRGTSSSNTDKETHSGIAPNSYKLSDETSFDVKEEPVSQPSFLRTVIISFRPDYVLNHLDFESFKVVLRTWVQNWGTIFVTIIHSSNVWIGITSYLFQIFGFIAPAGGGSIILNIFIALLCSVSASVAWAYAIISLAIAVKIRGWPTRLEIAQQLIMEGVCTPENIQVCLRDQIFSGQFLSTRCSVIHAIFLFLGVLFFGMLQKVHPLLRVSYVISMIVLCLTICYNILIPYFDPLLISWMVLKAIYFTFAVKIVSSIVIFPETSNYSFFKGVLGTLKALEAVSECNIRFFKSMKPSEANFSNYKKLHSDIVNIRNMMVPLELHAGLSNLEVSYGRLGPGAVGEIRSHLKNFINVTASFGYLYQLIDSRQNLTKGKTLNDRHKSVVSIHDHDHEGHSKLFGSIHQVYKPVGEFEHQRRLNLIKERLAQKSSVISLKDLDTISELLKPYFLGYMERNLEALKAVNEWIITANSFRFYTIFKAGNHQQQQQQKHQQLMTVKQDLVALLKELRDTATIEEYFKDKAKDEETMLALISEAAMSTLFIEMHTKLLLVFVDVLLSIDEHFPKPQFWTKFSKSIFDPSKNIYHGVSADEPQEEVPSYFEPRVQLRNPDSLRPTSVFHVINTKLVKGYNLLFDEYLWFWIRSGCLVVITAVPFMCKTTAGWYTRNKLVWVVIMCAVSTTQYTGETIYMFGAKMVYTFFGCVVGMVAWYISSGHGTGNPYGFAVVTAILFVHMAYYRHFSKHSSFIPQILYPVTTVLVLGTSWVDGNITNQVGNVGYGFRPAYTRFISVVIGLAIGFFASIIPKPKSSKVAIRKIIANVIDEMGEIHCDVTSFALRRIDNPSVHITSRHDPSIERLRSILIKLANTSILSIAVDHEITLTGKWPAAKYANLQILVTDIVHLYTCLIMILNEIENTDKWINHIINRAGWSDINMNADLLSTIHMCSRSLRWKTALPKVTQATLSLTHFNLLRQQWGINKYSVNERLYNSDMSQPQATIPNDLHKSMTENLDYHAMFSHDGNLNVVSLIICHMIYSKIDETAIITKSLVGEKYDLNEELLTRQFVDFATDEKKVNKDFKLD